MPLEPMLIGELGFNAPKHLSNSGPRHLNRGGGIIRSQTARIKAYIRCNLMNSRALILNIYF